MNSIRKNLKNINRARGQHAGLLLRRYLHVPVKDEDKQHNLDRQRLHSDAINAIKNSSQLYAAAFKRWEQELERAGSVHKALPTQGRLIVGLGGDNVLETGITLHHVYGVPIIPGSALKGLAAHYCDTVWGGRWETDLKKLTDDQYKFRRLRQGEQRGEKGIHLQTGKYHEVLFGVTDDAGHLIFHDAWLTPDSINGQQNSGLVLDVMTPHHSDYYFDENGNTPPTDFDDPIPITFLSATGSFLVAVSSADVNNPQSQKWTELAFQLLESALRDWGVGGKTSSGYGRLGILETTSNRVPNSSGSTSSSSVQPPKPNLPSPNDLVDAEILEKREKAGGKVSWRAKHKATGISGPIQNSGDLPSDTSIGQEFQLFVAYAKENEIAFKFPSESVKQMIAKAVSKQTIANRLNPKKHRK